MLAIFAGRGVDNAFKTTVCKRLLEKTEITEISSGAIKSGGVFKSALTTVVLAPRHSAWQARFTI